MLKNKLAVITGCNRGIGLKTMEIFSENGADIFACVRNIDKKFLEKIEFLQSNYKNKIFPVEFNLEDKTTISSAIKKINSYEKNINIKVNNAGIVHSKIISVNKDGRNL